MEYTLELPPSLIARFAAMGYPDPLVGLHDAAKLLLGIGPDAWATITQTASEQEITPAKLLLAKLNAPEPAPTPAEPAPTPAEPAPTPAEPTLAPAPNLPRNLATRRADIADRDAAIVQDYAAGGITQAGLATKYDLSVVRITQILAKHRADTAVNLSPRSTT
jgi:pyruvate/2-oxoglutarate dehydrogenase complex dihydrolipoamide acyltransferase (E2) component